MPMSAPLNSNEIQKTVTTALAEDIGSGDITAALIRADTQTQAIVISRENAVFCGIPWASETLKQVDPDIRVDWQVSDGDKIFPEQTIAKLSGSARSILTAERTLLNFLQTLSSTATQTNTLCHLVADTPVTLLDTRKTLPGLRAAQKYAVTQGGGQNHRFGLYDAYLIKENHISACGGIEKAIQTAQANQPDATVEIEVQNLDELQAAIDAGADIVMLDNFTLPQTADAVKLNANRVKLEASGNVDETSLLEIARTGVDFISIGAITKHCRAIDFSMLFEPSD